MEQDDFDIAEEFHNYVLAESEGPYHRGLVPDELCKRYEDAERIMRWTVLPFGWTCSPCFTLRMLARALELSMGNRKDETNPFQWDYVQHNLPSTSEYDPSIPRVRLIRKDSDVASGCVTFFDDGRVYYIGKERIFTEIYLFQTATIWQ
jgi:hypothetical protein